MVKQTVEKGWSIRLVVKQTSRLVKRTIKQSVLLVLSPKHPKAREGASKGDDDSESEGVEMVRLAS